MNRDSLELAQKATTEGWDAFKIMAEFCAYQKEQDAKIAETLEAQDVADAIRNS
jgi:hypothetical protein